MNRRKFPRLVYPCLVKVSSKDQTPDVFLTHTENIGVGGICVIVKKEIKLFSSVDIEIDLIDEVDHIVASGRVIWMVKRKAIEPFKPSFYDTGIEFENLNDKHKPKLDAAINKFIRKGYKVLKPVY
ncbi:MAG: PilZ domain-containing protein [Candidatus Omnitrophica bacterium]|nr:PilZ domain-containing protein [Candidatus Omnitrophota bacterium]